MSFFESDNLNTAVQLLERGDGLPESTGLGNAQESAFKFVREVYDTVGTMGSVARPPSREDVLTRPAFEILRALREMTRVMYLGPSFSSLSSATALSAPDVIIYMVASFAPYGDSLPPGATQVLITPGVVPPSGGEAEWFFGETVSMEIDGTVLSVDDVVLTPAVTPTSDSRFVLACVYADASGNPLSLPSYSGLIVLT